MLIIQIIEAAILSTALYYYLHLKTRISLKYLYQDNAVVIIGTVLLSVLLSSVLPEDWHWTVFVLIPGFVLGLAFTLTMIRFWRTPTRQIMAKDHEIVCPADGNVIYITRVEAGEVPVSIKGKRYSRLEELTKTDLLQKPCWLIGINMTPFDVHKNCAPIHGEVILNQHFKGSFLSLKNDNALTENERNTYVIGNSHVRVGIVQIASRLVRRIDSYVAQGAQVKQGQWLGMIRFGSQVDVIIPIEYTVHVKLKDQTYAGETILASLDEKSKL